MAIRQPRCFCFDTVGLVIRKAFSGCGKNHLQQSLRSSSLEDVWGTRLNLQQRLEKLAGYTQTTHTHTHSILTAIFPVESGLAGGYTQTESGNKAAKSVRYKTAVKSVCTCVL